MQSLTPKINELKARYKDKPDVMQKEMMKLYKENKVNPLSGCLPILVQMPFFFALYSALINSIDLWNAPFILWVKDLSMPDTVATISGFDINILPIFMTYLPISAETFHHRHRAKQTAADYDDSDASGFHIHLLVNALRSRALLDAAERVPDIPSAHSNKAGEERGIIDISIQLYKGGQR